MDRFLKNKYYNGKHLSTECFETEQAYNAARMAQMARLIFGKGVICGFKVTAMEPYTDTIEIGAGAAVDGSWRLITAYDKTILPVAAVEGFKAGGKKHTLKAVCKETQDSRSGFIAERCLFTFKDEPKGVALADITFEKGVISVSDARAPVDSQFLRIFAEKSISTLENKIEGKITGIFYKYLPNFVKHVLMQNEKNMEEAEGRAREVSKKYANAAYNALKKKFDEISDRVSDLEEELEKLKASPKPARRSRRVKHKPGGKK